MSLLHANNEEEAPKIDSYTFLFTEKNLYKLDGSALCQTKKIDLSLFIANNFSFKHFRSLDLSLSFSRDVWRQFSILWKSKIDHQKEKKMSPAVIYKEKLQLCTEIFKLSDYEGLQAINCSVLGLYRICLKALQTCMIFRQVGCQMGFILSRPTRT